MQLSVIIVNYNVKYFLQQALYSVRKACNGITAEIFVVDNNSIDGSCDMVRHLFPEVKLIENNYNAGFAKANNQAIKLATGKYVLLLNPDTVVEEDCFTKLINFMDATPDAGAVGVKMIDGSGKYLPESKRGLPTPEVAFYKIFGLAALFPKSKRFGKYHLGYLDNDQIHQIDVLAGAFMFVRRDLLLSVGMLDESYFMYGEDIDLSYCISQQGYKNYYYPHTTIIHYKGESTKRSSVNYVFTFYRAMVLFAQKHYSQKHAALFSFLIHFAIYIRAFAAIINRFLKKAALPIIDFVLFAVGIWLIAGYYAEYKFDSPNAYPADIVNFNAIIYSLLWILGLYTSGSYNKRKTFLSVTKGIAIGTLAIAVFYAFAPENYRFSRAVILLGASLSVGLAFLDRLLFYFIEHKRFSLKLSVNLKTVIVGNKEEVERVQQLLVKSKAKCHYLGYITIDNQPQVNDELNLGNIEQLDKLVTLFNIEEIIFCSKDLPSSRIIEWMVKISSDDVLFKIAPEQSLFIIGSNNKKTPGDFYTLEINLKLNKPFEQHKKRVFDFLVSLFMLLLLPLWVLFVKQKLNFIKNIFMVLNGNKTWVGYASANNIKLLPKLKKGIVTPLYQKNVPLNETTIQKMNFLYAKDYSIEKDFIILFRTIRHWGNS
jgi:GT2 family glycosyltransferase